MQNPVFHLYQLQKLDSRLDAIHARLSAIDSILKNDSRIKNAESILSLKRESLFSSQRKLKEIEDSIKSKRMKIEQSESSLYGGGIKNPKELQDLQKEIDSIKASILSLEENELEAMLDVETGENEVNSAIKGLEDITNLAFTNQSLLISEKSNLEKDAQKISQERMAIIIQILPEDIKKYEELRNKKRGIAVAIVEDQCCAACGAALTPSEFQAVKSPNTIFHCTSCGRLLYAG